MNKTIFYTFEIIIVIIMLSMLLFFIYLEKTAKPLIITGDASFRQDIEDIIAREPNLVKDLNGISFVVNLKSIYKNKIYNTCGVYFYRLKWIVLNKEMTCNYNTTFFHEIGHHYQDSIITKEQQKEWKELCSKCSSHTERFANIFTRVSECYDFIPYNQTNFMIELMKEYNLYNCTIMINFFGLNK